MNKNKKQLTKMKAQRQAEDARIEQIILPQIDQASNRFGEFLSELDALCAKHGFPTFLVSVGFEPKIDEKPVAFMAYAVHSQVIYADSLSGMMDAVVDCVDKTLHMIDTGNPDITPTFEPPTANA